MASDGVLWVRDLTIRYGGAVAVDSLSLEVGRGEIFGLLGPNGCGKSSTLAAVSGTLSPAAGEVRVLGLRAADRPDAYRQSLGLAPQELAFYEELTAADNLCFFGRLYGLGGRELARRVEEALAFVGLSAYARRTPRTFSGGMQRRLNLACALLHRPALLLLDEPTVGLDPQAREALFGNLRRLRDDGCALVFTTHYLDEAEQLCDRLGIMDHGRLMATGTLDELCEGRRCVAEGPHALRGPRLQRVFLQVTGRSLPEP
jgi:ABC-2 type transport system ATP-binding protein